MKTSNLTQLMMAVAGTSTTLLISHQTIVKSATVEYFNHNDFVNASGNLTVIDFDNIPVGNGAITGNEFIDQGLTIVHRDSQPINVVSLATNDQMTSNHINSTFNVISTTFFVGGGLNDNSDNYDFIFTNSTFEAGLYIGAIGSGSGSPTQVQFLNANNDILAEEIFTVDNPNLIGSGFDNRVFYGITSTEPIARIRTVEPANDGDAITYDDVQFSSKTQSIPESSNILGLFLVAGVSIFTGIKFKKKEDPQTEENT